MDEEQIEGAISISLEDIENLPQDGLSSGPANKQQETGDSRFSRFSLISWWDQEKIANAKILVVGAGALGNEILKNLVLTGFRNILVVDLDNIEHSNLSRSVLYRPDDIGKGKAETAAKAAMEIYEDAVVHPIDANICFNVGLGVFGWADCGIISSEAHHVVNHAIEVRPKIVFQWSGNRAVIISEQLKE